MNATSTTPATGGELLDTSRGKCIVSLAILIIIGIHIAGRVGSYCCTFETDSYIYSSFGYRIAQGEVLYRDMSDIKPPGLFMLYALVYLVSAPGRAAIVPIESFFLLAGYYAVFRLSAQIYGRTIALLVAFVAAMTINYFTVMGHVIGGFGLAENFMILPAAAGVLCYRQGLVRRRLWPMVAAGVWLGLDTSIKQTALPVVAAVGLHWSLVTLVWERSPSRWLRGCGCLLAGALVAWAPFVILMLAQETLGVAWTRLTGEASTMVTRGQAWPSMWRDVLPLWLPLGLGVWALLATIERSRNQHAGPRDFTVASSDLSLLLMWAAAELLLLVFLPLRSSHYYVATCVPIVILSGWPFMVMAQSVKGQALHVRRAFWSITVIGVAVFYRSTANEVVPTAMARYRSYDWHADQEFFDDAVNWGRVHFGEGPPYVRPESRE